MANIEEVLTNHSKELEGKNVKDYFENVNKELSELGYEVLINNKERQEFIPSDRFKSTVAQRDTFKQQAESLNKELESIKSNSKDEVLQKQLQEMIDKNNSLLSELETSKIENTIIMNVSDAINPKDVIVFIDKDKIKINAKGEVVGVQEEVERIRKEKPYLFGKKTSKGGTDNSSDEDDKGADINSIIRRAAGRSF